jgi:glycosyltransferase involved in cell wall biosynthesis
MAEMTMSSTHNLDWNPEQFPQVSETTRGHMLMKTGPVTISVVIPAYNASQFLPRCLASVFLQTRPADEVIVVDDGSTDNSGGVAETLGARVVRRRNGGLSAARNTGIQAASGQWIALLDADDVWAPEKLERQVAVIRSSSVLVYTGIHTFNETGVRSPTHAVLPKQARGMLRYRNPIVPSTVLVRRDALINAGGFREDIRACEDWDMWFRLLQTGRYECVPEPLTDYFIHTNSLSARPDTMLEALDRILETTLLEGLHGPRRWIWERRILAVQLCSAALIARDNRRKGELQFLLRSIGAWPSPLWESHRFVILAVSARNALFGLGSGHAR